MTDFSYIKTLFHIKENNGFSEEEMQKMKNTTLNIPKVLYDYYIQPGKMIALNQTQDMLLAPEKILWSRLYLLISH